jgi:hypothetical protein
LLSREGLDWGQEPVAIRRIVQILDRKHQEAKYAARAEWWIGLVLSVFGLMALGVSGYIVWHGWHRIFGLVNANIDAVVIPDNLWELAVATTGATLLVGGMATGLFQAGRQFFERAAAHSRVMVAVHRIQIGLRIALTCESATPGARSAMEPLARALVQLPAEEEKPVEDLTSLPTVLKELAGLVEKWKA